MTIDPVLINRATILLVLGIFVGINVHMLRHHRKPDRKCNRRIKETDR